MRFIKGDILSAVEQKTPLTTIVCHQVNCCGTMGAGLAYQIKSRFPNVFKLYKEKCDGVHNDNLGQIQLVSCLDEAGYIIANVFGQADYGRNKKQTDYNALRSAFRKLGSLHNVLIRIPYKMDCGLGGGDWQIVLKLIKEEIEDKGVPVSIWERENDLCELYTDNTNNIIIYHDVISPQNYLEFVTGKVYNLKSKDQQLEIEDILEKEGLSELWNFPLNEITEVIAAETSVVLVEVCDIGKDGNIIKSYRWFEIPDNLTRESIIERCGV